MNYSILTEHDFFHIRKSKNSTPNRDFKASRFISYNAKEIILYFLKTVAITTAC